MAKWVLRRWHESVTWVKGLRGDTQRIVLFAERRAVGREAVLVSGMLSLPLSPGCPSEAVRGPAFSVEVWSGQGPSGWA